MIGLINKFAMKCVTKEYITKDEAPFLIYELERIFVCVTVGIPFVLLGALITSPLVVISFYIGFYFLRTRISGFHAKGVFQCLCLTLMLELFFLGLLFRVLTIETIGGLLFFSSLIIFLFAPYRDANMNFTEEEVLMCARSAKRRIVLLLVLVVLLYKIGQPILSRGMSLGIVMATSLLAFAYVDQNIRECKDEGTKCNDR